jgi:hypothetical protein
MIWAAISSILLVLYLLWMVELLDILGNQVQPVVQVLLPTNDAVFQDNNSPVHTARNVQSWFEEHNSPTLISLNHCDRF